jgi:hypothetical protein
VLRTFLLAKEPKSTVRTATVLFGEPARTVTPHAHWVTPHALSEGAVRGGRGYQGSAPRHPEPHGRKPGRTRLFPPRGGLALPAPPCPGSVSQRAQNLELPHPLAVSRRVGRGNEPSLVECAEPRQGRRAPLREALPIPP